MKPRSALVVALIAVAVSAASCDLQIRGTQGNGGETNAFPEPLPSVSFDQSEEDPPSSSVAEVIESVLPSVVNVRVTALQQDAFGDISEGKGQGSGVVIDKRGVIITNNHVVQSATEVTIVLHDGRKLEGTVVGTDPEHDLAVVRVEADDLTPIEFGRSSALRLGDEVIALGFPLGLVGGPSVTQGIVSAQNRRIQIPTIGSPQESTLSGLIQTDAAINPGNSGGPLVDLNGRLVGINTAAAGAAAAENVGFAINIDSAIPIIQEIVTTPPEERAWMGVILSPLTPALAGELGIPTDTEGAVLDQIVSGSPAEEAGLEQGDVVTAVDGQDVSSPDELINALTEYEPGDVVELEVVDADESTTIDVELGVRPPAFDQ
jgi:serine protease Do